jgi:hypothetical protein
MTANAMREHDRVTVQKTITLEHLGDEPVQIRATSYWLTLTQNEHYTRRLTVTDTPHELAFPECPGLIVVQNNEGRNLSPAVKKEERQEIETRNIFVGDPKGFYMIVRPRGCVEFETLLAAPIFVWCDSRHPQPLQGRYYGLPR